MSNVTINKIKYQESSGKLTIEYMRTAETITDDVSVVDVPKPNNVVQMPTVAQ